MEVSGQYQTADNPIFEVFYLEDPHGVITKCAERAGDRDFYNGGL